MLIAHLCVEAFERYSLLTNVFIFLSSGTEKASNHYAKELDAHRTTVVKPGANQERSSVLVVFRKVNDSL